MVVEFLSGAEKGLVGSFVKNVFKQELAHDLVLYFEGDVVEVFLLLPEDGGAILLPEVPEVRLYLVFQLRTDIFALVTRLVTHVFYQHKPLL